MLSLSNLTVRIYFGSSSFRLLVGKVSSDLGEEVFLKEKIPQMLNAVDDYAHLVGEVDNGCQATNWSRVDSQLQDQRK